MDTKRGEAMAQGKGIEPAAFRKEFKEVREKAGDMPAAARRERYVTPKDLSEVPKADVDDFCNLYHGSSSCHDAVLRNRPFACKFSELSKFRGVLKDAVDQFRIGHYLSPPQAEEEPPSAEPPPATPTSEAPATETPVPPRKRQSYGVHNLMHLLTAEGVRHLMRKDAEDLIPPVKPNLIPPVKLASNLPSSFLENWRQALNLFRSPGEAKCPSPGWSVHFGTTAEEGGGRGS